MVYTHLFSSVLWLFSILLLQLLPQCQVLIQVELLRPSVQGQLCSRQSCSHSLG